MSRVRLVLLLLLALGGGVARAGPTEESAAFLARVRTKSGKLVHGRVAGPVASEDGPLLKVETTMGEILVPKASVEGIERVAPDATGVLVFQELWVVGLKGGVQRRPAGSEAWEPVAWTDPRYAEQGGRPASSLVRPGDAIRTGPDGQLDLMPTPDIWIRVGPDTEAELPQPGARISLRLQRGSLLQRVGKRPSTAPFVVAQPTLVLGVRGTYFRCVVGEDEQVQVLEGAIEVEGQGVVEPGSALTRSPAGAIARRPLTEQERAAFRVSPPTPIRESLAYVAGGRVVLRTPAKDPWPAPEAFGRPARIEASLDDYLIERVEVTNGEYATYAEATGAPVPQHFAQRRPRAGSESLPVYGLSLAMAEGYARWCGKDLPSDLEWEHAARGPESRLFPWGDDAALARELPIGAWASAAGSGLAWEPPSRLGDVWAPTADVSWMGASAMVSGPPEWVRDPFRSEPFFHPTGVSQDLGRGEGTLRGLTGRYPSSTYRQPAPRTALAGGLRLVKRLE